MTGRFVSRRAFLKGSALAAAATTVPSFNILPAGESPNERVNAVMLGCGWRGTQLLPFWQKLTKVVAVCDPIDHPNDEAWVRKYCPRNSVKSIMTGLKNNVYEGLTRYPDYRVMFEKIGRDFDAVLMHMRCGNNLHVAMTAMDMGKHIYVEKPMCYTVEEAHLMRKKSLEKNVVTQFGTQGHSSGAPQMLREWVEKGWLGKNIQIHTDGGNDAFIDRNKPAEPVPPQINWDVFQGPAEVTTFNPLYTSAAGQVKDFSIGGIGEVAIHSLDGAFWAGNIEHPTSFKLTDLPAGTAVEFVYPSKISWQNTVRFCIYRGRPDTSKYPSKHPIEPDAYQQFCKQVGGGYANSFIIGDKETAVSRMHKPLIYDYNRMRAFVEQHGPILLGQYAKDHARSFIQAIKDNRPKDALANFDEYASNLMEMILLSVIARRLKKKDKVYEYDAVNVKIPNDPEADALLRREYREGFRLS
jgi:hypothetical protein